MHDGRPESPPSAAVMALGKQLIPKAQTPRERPALYKSPETDGHDAMDTNDDPSVNSIESRSPGKETKLDCSDQEQNQDPHTDSSENAKNDSFVDQITTRSPIKHTMRIEDSVEAIDALEEAIEKIGESLPVIEDEPHSPVKTSPGRKGASKYTRAEANATKSQPLKRVVRGAVAKNAVSSNQSSKNVVRTAAAKSAAVPSTTRASTTRASTARASTIKPHSVARKSASTKRSSSSKQPPPMASKSIIAADRDAPASQSRPGPAKKRAVSSVHKAPFQPAKSKKPPTRPSFELPGEAISRKLKEQKEERLKREEEVKTQKREFKARPVRLSQAPVVRPTTASKSRMSLVRRESREINPKINAPIVDSSMPRSSTGKRSSVTNTSRPIRRGSSLVSNASARGLSHGGVTPAEEAQQKVRGKEIFGRDRLEKEERDRAKTEKEEAAKRARVEAAERGRQASRQWAEKMRAKRMKQDVSASQGAAGGNSSTKA